MMEAMLIPSLLVLAVLSALRAGVNVYEAFVRGAREGLRTLASVAPYLAAVLTAASLLRGTGLMDAAQRISAPLLSALGIPAQCAGVILLRPLSGSAALAEAAQVMALCGPDSRAARMACVIGGAAETLFFTGALYMGAAGAHRGGCAVPAALAAYAVCVLTSALCC